MGSLDLLAGSNTGTLTLHATSTAPRSMPKTVTVNGVAETVNASQPLTIAVRCQAGDIDSSFGSGTPVTPVGTTDDYDACSPCECCRQAKPTAAISNSC